MSRRGTSGRWLNAEGNYCETRPDVTRRRVLQAGGAGAAAALAGCFGGDDGTDTPGDDETGGGDPIDPALTEPTTDNPTDWQFNVYNFAQPFGHAMNNDQFVWYHIGRDEYTWRLLDIAEFNGDGAVVEMADDRYWHDEGEQGRNVDAEDLRTKLVMESINSSDLGVLYEDVSVAGDHSVELDFGGTLNRDVFDTGWTNIWLDTKREQYQEFLDRWEDGEAEADIQPDLQNMTLDEVEGHGPFEVIEITDTRLRMELFDDHPDAENINWQYWDIERVGSDTAQVIMGGEVDTIRNFTAEEAVLNSRPDDLTVGFLPALWGMSLPFNHEHDDVGNPRVRQALAEFINREAVATSYGQMGQAVQAPSGLLGNIDGENNPTDSWRDWVSGDVADTLSTYEDPERGRELLRAEGYTKDGGQWFRPNGDRFELTVKIPADITDWHPIYQTVEGQLREEGIGSSTQAIDDTTYWPDHYLGGNFELAATGWTLQNPYPFFTFNMYYTIDAQFLNLTAEEVVAPPMGEPDGELESVDVPGLMNDLRTSEADQAQDLIGELAWITNQYLPMLPLTEINDTVWFWEHNWTVPDPEEEAELYQSKWPLWQFPRQGHLQAKTE